MYECPVCKKKLVRHQSLRDHKLMHINMRPHKCTICGKSFLRPSSLRTHMIVHSADSPFACDLCPAKFKRSSVLKTHKLTHTGVRRFECDICKHRFHLKGALKHHILAHYGELVNILTTSLRPAEEAEGVCRLIRPSCCTRSSYLYLCYLSPFSLSHIEAAGPLTSHIYIQRCVYSAKRSSRTKEFFEIIGNLVRNVRVQMIMHKRIFSTSLTYAHVGASRATWAFLGGNVFRTFN